MPLIPYPNVPPLPGVPLLPRLPGQQFAGRTILGVLNSALWRLTQVQTRWGVFDSRGRPILDNGLFRGLLGVFIGTLGGDNLSTGSVEYSKETKVSDFPVEGGKFAAYNKVENPATPTVTMRFSGSEGERKRFLDTIDAAVKSTDLFSVVTPEVTYLNYTIERYSYRRSPDNGAYLLTVELYLREVRQVTALYTVVPRTQIAQPKDAGAAPKVDGGKVQPKAPDKSTLKKLSEKFPVIG